MKLLDWLSIEIKIKSLFVSGKVISNRRQDHIEKHGSNKANKYFRQENRETYWWSQYRLYWIKCFKGNF